MKVTVSCRVPTFVDADSRDRPLGGSFESQGGGVTVTVAGAATAIRVMRAAVPRRVCSQALALIT